MQNEMQKTQKKNSNKRTWESPLTVCNRGKES